jgi:PucR family transcriptional regulator, purine catabolism regulatory protein
VALTLADVLAHPVLVQCRPAVLAGDPTTRTVRWVHSSDIYEIAPLLRGGELLLTTGLGLVDSTPGELRAYVRALAERDVAGLALELAGSLPEPPTEMIEESSRLGLPFVALHRRYPFVEVTEQVNSTILESSIVRLRHADEIGRNLSRVLAQQGGLGTLTTTLASLLQRDVVVTDFSGDVLASTSEEPSAVLAGPSAAVTITSEGVYLGELAIGDGNTEDDLVRAAVDRAPEIFAIEVLRGQQQPVLTARARKELLRRLLLGTTEDAAGLLAHASTSHIRSQSRWAGVAVEPTDDHTGLSLVERIARQAGVKVISAELEEITCALIALPESSAHEALGRILAGLRRSSGPLVVLGPVVDASGAGRSLRAAHETLSLGSLAGGGDRVVLAESLALERLLRAVDDPTTLADLVEEQLGGLLHSANSRDLLVTLERYLEAGGCKASTARSLHLRRQSVHERLHRINKALGYDVSDPRRQPLLWLALTARRLLAAPRAV